MTRLRLAAQVSQGIGLVFTTSSLLVDGNQGRTFAVGFAIRLEFDEPIYGPIALGYGSHFGLGLFERTTDC